MQFSTEFSETENWAQKREKTSEVIFKYIDLWRYDDS